MNSIVLAISGRGTSKSLASSLGPLKIVYVTLNTIYGVVVTIVKLCLLITPSKV